MAKKGNTRPKRQTQHLGLPRAGGTRLRANATKLQAGMDTATQRYLRLLSDPCASDLTPPTYGGTGSGYLMRTKQILTPLSTNVDAVLEYTPSWGSGAVRLCTATTSGGALSAAAYTAVPIQLSNIAESWRPVAACVKIYYTGSEMSRSGMVFGNLLDAPSINTTETPVAGAPTYAASAARFVRLGAEMHEFRWCPTEYDQNFGTLSSAVPGAVQYFGSTLQVGYTGVPAGTVNFEITTVWEWQPQTGANVLGSAIVSTPRAPVTPMSLNNTLHRLGNLAEWATKPANQAKALKFGQGLYNTVRMVRPALAALTL